MGFELTEEQLMIADAAQAFAAERLAPNAERWEEEATLDRGVLLEMGALGFGGVYMREDIGGSGLGRLESVLIFEQLARGCISTSTFVSIHNMASGMVDAFGDEGLRKKYAPKLASLELAASYCLTEPNAGSDAGALRTTARKDGDSYVLNGSKCFISGGNFSDVYVVMARTADTGAAGVSAFVVENGTPGLSFGKNEKKMGWKASPTAMVLFDDCRIPAGNRIGAEGDGFKFAMKGLDGGRLNISAASLGGATEAFERAVTYAKDRKQFSKAIADFQATQFKLADMETQLQAGRAFLYEAARRLDARDPAATKFCAMAKRFVTDMGFAVANDALQIHGGYGYLSEYGIERIVRDLRVHQILEGTNEIMRVIVAREILKA